MLSNIQTFIDNIVNNLEALVASAPYFVGIMLGMLVIMTESMIPVLPLCVFIALNIILFGNFIGILMSYIATSIGCILMFYLSRKVFRKHFEKMVKKSDKLKKLMKKIGDMKLSTLVLITALPFTPAFTINIVAGLSKMDKKKFILNILISKPFMIYFWGVIGSSLLESITDIGILIKVAVMLAIAYALSKLVMQKVDID